MERNNPWYSTNKFWTVCEPLSEKTNMKPYFWRSSDMTWFKILFSSAGSLNRWLDGMKKLELEWIFAPNPILCVNQLLIAGESDLFSESGFYYLFEAGERPTEDE
jgi:hypothetical protein